ncbi:Zn-dependent oligopeptidase [Corallococcus sp. bb12-1]|uniref:M3 family metallopeptidase n=1 Tax=Corallococcus sp. bb12-1 TaxID=2996784 RepID=UPI00226D4A30|nr:M3 family metallopeptidase [Corallococcus sp. bb12-1]MCY1046768.1 Zn-dependent oligopeptidase [Corallococcus sp. bb12-1]
MTGRRFASSLLEEVPLKIPALTVIAALAATGCSNGSIKNNREAQARIAANASKPQLEPFKGSEPLAGTPDTFKALCKADLERAQAQVVALKKLDAKSNGQAVLKAYDEAQTAIMNAANRASLTQSVHPDPALRDASRECEQQVDAANVAVSQDRGVYDALSLVDLSKADAPTQHWVSRALLEFRRVGVDRDEPTRQKVKELNEEILKLGQQFGKNIAEDIRKVAFTPKELDGLPEDYKKAHAPGADGKVVITSNYPDYFPFMTYAKNAKAREKLWRAYRQRAFPNNQAVLAQLIEKRNELATLLGYANWAAFTTETRMTRTQQAAADFIDQLAQSTEARAKKEMAELLARKKKDVKGATVVEPWDHDYYEDRVRAERFGFDSQTVRPYLEYARVKDGVMGITSSLWGVTFQPVKDVKTWHTDVEAYDVLEGGKPLGRVFLDMHPRDDKYKHAAQFDLITGEADRRLPEAVLVCNFPRPGDLMTHDEVETFFHEFGHLMHTVFSGHQKWTPISGISTERDFVETPSMLLQQWAQQPEVLKSFAKHHETNEPIPAELVEKLRASKEFGQGLWARRQLFLSAVSLQYYSRAPGFDTSAVLSELQKKLSPFRHEYRDGTHFEVAFGHLDGYSAAYYTYLWSYVIAKDLESEFQKAGYLDRDTAMKYRHTVLDPGGSKPAADQVKDFLGRPYAFDAFRAYLDGSAKTTGTAKDSQ